MINKQTQVIIQHLNPQKQLDSQKNIEEKTLTQNLDHSTLQKQISQYGDLNNNQFLNSINKSTISEIPKQSSQQSSTAIACLSENKQQIQKVNQISTCLDKNLINFDREQQQLALKLKQNLQTVCKKNQKALELYQKFIENTKQNINEINIDKYCEDSIKLLGVGSKAINQIALENIQGKAQRAQQFNKIISQYCQAAAKYYDTWEIVQNKIQKVHEKKLQQQQKKYYKQLAAYEKQRQSKLKIVQKQRKQKQKTYQKQIQLQNKKYMTQLKQIQKKFKDQLQKKQAEQDLKNKNQKVQAQIYKQRRLNRLQIEEKQKSIEIELQSKKQYQRLANEKIKQQQQLQLQAQYSKQEMKKSQHLIQMERQKLKNLLIQKNNQSIQIQFDRLFELYKIQLEDANKFIENQRRNGKSYTWGCTPPSIITEDEKRYVKPGNVWYNGK